MLFVTVEIIEITLIKKLELKLVLRCTAPPFGSNDVFFLLKVGVVN